MEELKLPPPGMRTTVYEQGREHPTVIYGYNEDDMRAAILAERERCAKVCDEVARKQGTLGRMLAAQDCAAAIRKGE